MRLIMSIVLKKRLLAIGAALIFALSGSTVLAGSYHLGVFTKNGGVHIWNQELDEYLLHQLF